MQRVATNADLVLTACADEGHADCFKVDIWWDGPFGEHDEYRHMVRAEVEGLIDSLLDSGASFLQARML